MTDALQAAAVALAARLESTGRRIVLAESCTGGLVAATLTRLPGISAHLCGSAVTYREATKRDWLDVSADDLAAHTAVSEPVARQMAAGVLVRTSEADLAAAVTGHLGPDAPPGQDGLVFVAIAGRGERGADVRVTRHQLVETERTARQREAARRVLEALTDAA